MLRNIFNKNVQDKNYFYRSSFYHNSNYITNKNRIIDLISLEDRIHVTLPQIIRPVSFPFDSVTKDIKLELGKPNYILSNCHDLKKYDVLFYKKNSAKLKSIIQFHFFEKKLFLVCTTYLDSKNSEIIKTSVINNFIDQGIKISVEKYDQYLFLDRDNNKLFFDDSFYFRLVFLTGNNSVINDLTQNIKRQKPLEEEGQIISREINEMIFSK